MTPDTSEQLLVALQAERRPAIWPWLVMPLVTLALFYGLHYGLQHERLLDDMIPAQTSHAATTTPDNQ